MKKSVKLKSVLNINTHRMLSPRNLKIMHVHDSVYTFTTPVVWIDWEL